MRITILLLALFISFELLAAEEYFNSNSYKVSGDNSLRQFNVFNQHVSRLKQKVHESRKSTKKEEQTLAKKAAKEEMERKKIIEKHLVPHANGTTLLKDFYAGRFLIKQKLV